MGMSVLRRQISIPNRTRQNDAKCTKEEEPISDSAVKTSASKTGTTSAVNLCMEPPSGLHLSRSAYVLSKSSSWQQVGEGSVANLSQAVTLLSHHGSFGSSNSYHLQPMLTQKHAYKSISSPSRNKTMHSIYFMGLVIVTHIRSYPSHFPLMLFIQVLADW